MNIYHYIKEDIINIVQQLKSHSMLSQLQALDNLTLEAPKDATFGDMSTNVAMVLAKQNNLKPKELAEIIANKIQGLPKVESVVVAGAGFINITLKKDVWYLVIKDILQAGRSYGDSNLGKNEKINLEYVSVNPTGPMHIGHARAAVFGDALAMLLIKCGFEVTKEYYINDAGKQIDYLAESTFLRYQQIHGMEVEFGENMYPGEYLISVAAALTAKYQANLLDYASPAEIMPLIKPFVIEAMMNLIKTDLADLGIVHDVFTSEESLHKQNKIEQAVAILVEKDLVYHGVLELPKGKSAKDWEERKQLLFKSTVFGDDIDRALQKSDGSWTYFAADLAYILDKVERGFNSMIMVLGADHIGYTKRTKAATNALTTAVIDVKICQLVKLMRDGAPFKMSKRSGNFITLRDVLELVGKDAMRFMMLIRKNDQEIDFDVVKVQEQSKDNPIFYVQYAHARCQSIIRSSTVNLTHEVLHHLVADEELQLIKFLALWPKIVEASAINHEPHRVVFYLQELAALFHSLWHKGKTNKDFRFIIAENDDLSLARLMLIKSVAIVIASALAVLNIEPINEM
jgi:arginyl-tRNA synthetase